MSVGVELVGVEGLTQVVGHLRSKNGGPRSLEEIINSEPDQLPREDFIQLCDNTYNKYLLGDVQTPSARVVYETLCQILGLLEKSNINGNFLMYSIELSSTLNTAAVLRSARKNGGKYYKDYTIEEIRGQLEGYKKLFSFDLFEQ